MSTRPRTPAAQKMRRFRASPSGAEYVDRERRRNTARDTALAALARQHPAEFAALYEAELKRAGLADVAMERPCPCGGIIRRRYPQGRWPATCGDCPPPQAPKET